MITNYKYVRYFNEDNKLKFTALLSSVDWENKLCASANSLAQSIINIITNKLDISFPLRKTYFFL